MRAVGLTLRLASTGGVLLVAAGCVPQATHPNVVVVRETRNQSIAAILGYGNSVLALAPDAQTAARDSLARQFQLTQFPEDRMRLALLDTLLPAPVGNDHEARVLLTGYNWSAQGPGFKGLAGSLMQILAERKVQAQAAAGETQKRADLEQQLAGVRADNKHLQQQLDALMHIEKTVNNRTPPTVPVPAGTRPAAPPATTTHPHTPGALPPHGDLANAAHRYPEARPHTGRG